MSPLNFPSPLRLSSVSGQWEGQYFVGNCLYCCTLHWLRCSRLNTMYTYTSQWTCHWLACPGFLQRIALAGASWAGFSATHLQWAAPPTAHFIGCTLWERLCATLTEPHSKLWTPLSYIILHPTDAIKVILCHDTCFVDRPHAYLSWGNAKILIAIVHVILSCPVCVMDGTPTDNCFIAAFLLSKLLLAPPAVRL